MLHSHAPLLPPRIDANRPPLAPPPSPALPIEGRTPPLPETLAWEHIRVIAELKVNPGESDTDHTVIQLASYVREIFWAQPTRRWVHAFTLCGDLMRCYRFDRSGLTTSTAFSINARPLRFARIACSYACMDAEQLGFDPTIRWAVRGTDPFATSVVYDSTVHRPLDTTSVDGEIFIATDSSSNPDEALRRRRFILDASGPLCKRSAIVTRGTVCFTATICDPASAADHGRRCVVKDLWRDPSRPAEGGLLEALQEPGRLHLPSVIWHAELGNITCGSRSGINFARPANDGEEEEHATPPTQSTLPPTPVQSSSGRKRPRRGGNKDESNSKRRKRSLTSDAVKTDSVARVRVGDEKIPQPQKDKSLILRPDNSGFRDRVHTRVVMTPVGRPLFTYTSTTELLCALRDAIVAHRYLYFDATPRLLHRDVSINNILICDPPDGATDARAAGLLIDLDLAVPLNRIATSGARYLTGTMHFLAVGILQQAVHNARHDLESFFWVLYYILVYHGSPDGEHHTAQIVDPNNVFALCERIASWEGQCDLKMAVVHSEKALASKIAKASAPRAVAATLRRWRCALWPPDYGPAPDETMDEPAIAELYAQMLTGVEKELEMETEIQQEERLPGKREEQNT